MDTNKNNKDEEQNSPIDKEHQYLLDTAQECLIWLNRNAPDNIAETYLQLIKLVGKCGKRINEQTVTITTQNSIIDLQTKTIDDLLDQSNLLKRAENYKKDFIKDLENIVKNVVEKNGNK